jgi:hypothetical protein
MGSLLVAGAGPKGIAIATKAAGIRTIPVLELRRA